MAALTIEPGKTRIGWIGTGVMGSSMCGHLIDAGFSATVFSRTKSKADGLVAKGAGWADSPRAVAEASDVVFSIVGFPNDVREVMLGDGGALAGSSEGNVLVDMTTSDPSLAVEIHAAAKARGVASVDAPVSGGDVGAKNGALSIMIGGDKEVVDALDPCWQAMGKTIVHQGGPGAGQHTKMVNQILIATNMIGVCEALLYGHKAGLDLPTVMESVGSGAAGSWSLANLGPRIMDNNFDPGFFVEHFIKDMSIALAEGKQMGLSLPGLALSHQLYLALQAQDTDATARTLFNCVYRNCRTWIGRADPTSNHCPDACERTATPGRLTCGNSLIRPNRLNPNNVGLLKKGTRRSSPRPALLPSVRQELLHSVPVSQAAVQSGPNRQINATTEQDTEFRTMDRLR